MFLVKNRKKHLVKDVFKNCDEFILFLKENYNNLNLENEEIIIKTKKVYNLLCNEQDDTTIRFNRLTRFLYKIFEFKYTRAFQKNFWLERGWSENDFIEKHQKKILENLQNTIELRRKRNLNKDIFTEDGNEYIFKFRKIEYKSKYKPCCNLCGHELRIKKNIC